MNKIQLHKQITLDEALKIAKEIPVFKVIRPAHKDTVDEQMNLILANF